MLDQEPHPHLAAPTATHVFTMSTRKRSRSGRQERWYSTDRVLTARVKQYVAECPEVGGSGRKVVDVGDMALALQRQYSDYARRKRAAFKSLVSNVYRSLGGEAGMETRLQELEEAHERKRGRKNWQPDSDDDSIDLNELMAMDSEETDEEAAPPAIAQNLLNQSVVDVYGSRDAAAMPNKSVSQNGISHPLLPLLDKETAVGAVTADGEEDSGTRVSTRRERDSRSRGKKSRGRQKKGHWEEKVGKDGAVLAEEDKKKISTQPVQSTVRFDDVGGCESTLKDLCQLLLHISHTEVFDKLGVTPPRGFLLHGPPGCGKTLLAHAIAGELGYPLIKLAATEVVSGVSGETEEKIRELFQLAKDSAPCVLFFDEIDSITPKRENAQREMERRIVAQLLACLDDLNQHSAQVQVLVIGATNRPDALDPSLRRAGRFDREICLGIPDERAREKILEVQCRNMTLEDGLSYSSLAHRTPGYVGADLVALVREAALCAVNRVLLASHSFPSTESNPMSSQDSHVTLNMLLQLVREHTTLSEDQLNGIAITCGDFEAALGLVQPSAKREGFATVPDTTWDDVGALLGVREELSMAILAPVHFPDQFARLGLRNPPGILLAGPPGCGKTLLAKAIANESGINFISVKGPELLNMYVGESERAVRQVFQRAKNSVPCVIFFDELDSLCPRRSDTSESSASARVVNQLLTEMDGLETRKQVFVMGATNRPDMIDPAVLRPGRLDKVLYVGLPSPLDRAAILKTITKNGTIPKLSEEVDLEKLAQDQRCKGFSGADLAALVREASAAALKELIVLSSSSSLTQQQQQEAACSSEPCCVGVKHFETAFLRVKPSVSEKDCLTYLSFAEKYITL